VSSSPAPETSLCGRPLSTTTSRRRCCRLPEDSVPLWSSARRGALVRGIADVLGVKLDGPLPAPHRGRSLLRKALQHRATQRGPHPFRRARRADAAGL
jgi:hypothetical protein